MLGLHHRSLGLPTELSLHRRGFPSPHLQRMFVKPWLSIALSTLFLPGFGQQNIQISPPPMHPSLFIPPQSQQSGRGIDSISSMQQKNPQEPSTSRVNGPEGAGPASHAWTGPMLSTLMTPALTYVPLPVVSSLGFLPVN